MDNVWAYRTENLGTTFKVAGEWDRVITFDTLADLAEELRKANMAAGQVSKLGIVAHGNTPGVVQLKPAHLTAASAGQYSADFTTLRKYLRADARVIFYSCIAGQGSQGSALLNELSEKHLGGRHVIGFERYGLVGSSPPDEPAGKMRCNISAVVNEKFLCDPTSTGNPVTDRIVKADQILNEYSIYAKWSYRGQIIKLPYDETIRQTYSVPEVRCGPAAVKKAADDPLTRAEIDYIAINTTKSPSKALIFLYVWVQEAPRDIKWSRVRDVPRRRLIEFSEEDRKLVREHGGKLEPRDEIVAVFKKKMTPIYKCAWGLCPGHLPIKDYCTQNLEHVPNGPLK